MVDISLEINLDDIIDDVENFYLKQVPYAAHLALNESVFKSSVGVKKAMPYFIEGGPVAFTKRGVQYRKSKNKRDLTASVFIPDAQWKYMQWVIDAGVKRFTRSKHGGSKPIYANTKFNRYGNIPGRKRKEKIWRDTLDQMGGAAGAPRGKLGKNQFIGTVNGITGLWKRERNRVRLLVVFNRDPINYGSKGRFPFRKFAEKYVYKNFRPSFNRKLMQLVNRDQSSLKVR